MASALEQYVKRTGAFSPATGTLGLKPPPSLPPGATTQPQLDIPKFTSVGDRLAALGGFGDDPGELKTQTELQAMTQEQINEYAKKRKQARTQGIAETLIRMGEAFQGMPASQNAIARQQARQQQELYQRQVETWEDAYAQGNENQKKILGVIGPTGFANIKQKQAEQQLSGTMFEGAGVANQFYNILLQGQKDPSLRSSPQYKTAYDYLSQPKTETYINEFGQQVKREIPGMISKADYLPPTGVIEEPSTEKIFDTKEKEEVIQVSPERRKDLQKKIDTAQDSLAKINAFKQRVIELEPSPLTLGTERADIESRYTRLLLELKNLEELGVLAGPDLDLLQSMVGDPTGIKQFFISGGAEGILIQLDNLVEGITSRTNDFIKEIGGTELVSEPTTATAFMPDGREIKVVNNKWVYSDTGEPVE